MDPSCLDHVLSEDEAATFDRDGYLIVEDALDADQVAHLSAVVDRLVESDEITHAITRREGRVNALDMAGLDPALLDLVDHPRTLPKVWGILGWNIHLYHSHFIVGAPGERSTESNGETLRWHQDSGRVNLDIETDPRPRISLKVAFIVSDASEPGRGNMWILPGSHLRNEIDLPASGIGQPNGAMPIVGPAGTAVLFDRRLWHAGSPNYSSFTRKALFYGYSYRWVHTRDERQIPPQLYEAADPIRKQILGYAPTNMGRTSPANEDVPLKVWLEEYHPETALR